VGLALVLAGTVGVLAWQPAWIAALLRTLPGADPTTGLGRYVLFGQAWQLAQATPFTGGGLGAFPALYSTYIHDIPHFLLPHAHNNYLNVLVEQGWPGLAALVLALVSAGWVAARGLAEPPAAHRALLVAGAAGLVMASVHGLGDASLVATWAAPFLLVPAGLVAATAPPPASARPWHRPWLPAALAACVLSLGALLTAGPRPLAAAWEANLGAVQQSRVWLRNWPTGEWYDGTQAQAQALAVAQQHYAAALEWDPRNVSAHFGLGLLARGGQDFETAALHLDQALALAPTHRGVIKVLGYTDVWLGRPDSAEPLLRQIPEAARELSVYVGWWGEQGRPDLADRAAQMQARLER
jgi:hypothetical protein